MNGNIVNTTNTAMRLDNEEKATLQGLPDISMDFNMHDGYSEIACSLGNDFVNYKCGRTTSRPPSIYAETLRRVGDEIEEKYNISLNGIVNQLKYDPNTDGKKAFYASLDAMFEEGPEISVRSSKPKIGGTKLYSTHYFLQAYFLAEWQRCVFSQNEK
ncbi:hypothetical protein HOLleu_29103 [Holothuria leucospilota]|uniref:Uncharacterized protein n=1 Tax=Holothuria leucospilota TaxID=206669 RepID=A0A9Q1BMZ7_HOLLE|nr:hypothetical protein HOLleu_29103 [Holothuria leucospilota]